MQEESTAEHWRKCSNCKKPISFGATYYVCSVSTCNGQRTGYVFCTVLCFEAHLPGARHRDAAAVEMKAPARLIVRAAAATNVSGVSSSSGPASAKVNTSQASQEVLIIASRLKDHIYARAEMNTSAAVMDVLSEHIRVVCERAIGQARSEGRKTVLDRDFAFLKSLK